MITHEVIAEALFLTRGNTKLAAEILAGPPKKRQRGDLGDKAEASSDDDEELLHKPAGGSENPLPPSIAKLISRYLPGIDVHHLKRVDKSSRRELMYLKPAVVSAELEPWELMKYAIREGYVNLMEYYKEQMDDKVESTPEGRSNFILYVKNLLKLETNVDFDTSRELLLSEWIRLTGEYNQMAALETVISWIEKPGVFNELEVSRLSLNRTLFFGAIDGGQTSLIERLGQTVSPLIFDQGVINAAIDNLVDSLQVLFRFELPFRTLKDAMYSAIEEGSLDAMRVLKEKMDYDNGDFNWALQYAADVDQPKAIDIIVNEWGANDLDRALALASKEGSENAQQKLLELKGEM